MKPIKHRILLFNLTGYVKKKFLFSLIQNCLGLTLENQMTKNYGLYVKYILYRIHYVGSSRFFWEKGLAFSCSSGLAFGEDNTLKNSFIRDLTKLTHYFISLTFSLGLSGRK